MHETAQIITSYGRRYIVRTDSGRRYEASTRKKRVDFACGDFVRITPSNTEQAVIEDYLPRQSLLYRQDAYKSKLIAANVSQLIIVTAAVPSPSETLLQRALIAAEAAHIRAAILLNKADLPESAALATTLEKYRTLGYPVISVSALDTEALKNSLQPLLAGHTSIFLGQSGMGKSTLTNALLGQQVARTSEHSAALDSGKHTTTHAQLYDLDAASKLIDAPGLQEFGLHHLSIAELPHYFPDCLPLIGQCRFHNCTHRAEPGCAFKAAAEQGELDSSRLALLQKITDELSNTNR